MANLGLIGGILGSAVAGAIGSALNKGSSSGSSSGSSTGSKSSSGSSSSSSGSSSGSSNRYSGSSSSNRNSSSSSGSYSSSFSPSFDQNTDYQALINDAVSKGDYMSAAKYEQQRNAKINAGYGNGYNTTNYYTGYLNGSNYYGNNSSSNPYSGNRYINDYDTLAGLTMPYLDSNGNLTTKKADIGVKLDLYDQMYNLEHDDLARAQYDHWRALATGVDDLLSIPDRQLLGLPIGYTVLNDPRAFYDEVPRQERSSSSSPSSSSYSDDDSSYTPTTYNALGYTVPSAANTSNLNYLYSIPASQLTPEMVSSLGQNTITNPLYASGTTGYGTTGATGTTGYGTTSGSIAPINYGNVDIGNTFWQAALSGADAEYLQSLANARLDKAGTTSGLGQYYNDQNQLAMQGYVNNLMQQEQAVSQLEAANQAAMDQFNNQYMLLQQQNDAMLNSFNQYYDQAYAQQQAAYQAAADAARQQYLQMLPDINTSYDQSARQAYINNMMAQRDLPEQLSAAGVGGQGVSESAIIAQNNAYNAAYNQNELARQQAIQDINNAAANAYANAGVQGAQAAAELYLQQANAQQNILSQQQANRYNYLAMLADMQNNAINNQYNYLLAQNSLRNDALNNLYNYSGLTGTIGGVPTLAGQELAYNQAYNNAMLEQSQQSQDREYWLQKWQGMGTRGATAEIAAALGIPVGAVYGKGTYSPDYI